MWLYYILLISFVVGSHCAKNATDCVEKEKSKGVLDFAKDSINKVKHLLPNCSDDSSNSSECGAKEKAIAFLEIATELITKVENNYQTCPDPQPEPKPEPEPEPKPEPEPEPKPEPVVICNIKPMDCTDVLLQGKNSSGVYDIWPRSRLMDGRSIKVYCDLETDGGGWTVIQRRSAAYEAENFDRDWESYRKGFGNLEKEFWLGNDKISNISNQANYEVRFDLKDFQDNSSYAVYKTFWIEDEAAEYRLHISNYSGTAGDSMNFNNNQLFSTKDRHRDLNLYNELCTTSRGAAWWYNSCTRVNLNGIPRSSDEHDPKILYWRDWQDYTGLAYADMKLRRI